MRRHHLILPLAALIAVSPLLFFGTSCGHDIEFHLQNWVEAAAQFRHGTLYPQWAFSTAWQAGEPRFVFYPPLSWMFGALLTFALPMAATTSAFIFVALLAAGYSMHAVLRRFVSPNAALVAACVYLANPYMFFNAFERSAFAELLASVWIPLLFLAILSRRPGITVSACGLALAWLTNVPAGIMATYVFVVLAGTRLLFEQRLSRKRLRMLEDFRSRSPQTLKSKMMCFVIGPEDEAHHLPLSLSHQAVALTSALGLGLTLPAFYLLPALHDKHFVQSSMLLIENLRYQDNFLFHNTESVPHNTVTHAVSLIAVVMLFATACLLTVLFARRRTYFCDPKLQRTRLALAVLFALILFLLLPLSGHVWAIIPELPFLQFPWRLLTILAALLSISLALTLRDWQKHRWLAPSAALLYVALVAGISSHLYRQACDDPHLAQTTLDTFHAQHGVGPTDEYTPANADNDVLRTGSPGYWLAPLSDPSAYAAGTLPNPNEYDPNYDSPIPYEHTWAHRAPMHLDLNLPQASVLVLNLRDFPDWRITRNGGPPTGHLRRDDGLTAIPLPPGPSHIEVVWHRGWNVYAGDALTLCALLTLFFFRVRFRDSEHPASVH